MKKLLPLSLIIGTLFFSGCGDLFDITPKSCDQHRLICFMNKYHGGINKDIQGIAPFRDFDSDGKNDFYVLGKDNSIVAQLTSKHDNRWYCLGTNGVWMR